MYEFFRLIRVSPHKAFVRGVKFFWLNQEDPGSNTFGLFFCRFHEEYGWTRAIQDICELVRLIFPDGLQGMFLLTLDA